MTIKIGSEENYPIVCIYCLLHTTNCEEIYYVLKGCEVMQFLSIGVNDDADSLKEYLINELARNNKKNINYLVRDVADSEGSTSIICSLADNDAPSDMNSHLYKELVLNVSNALATFIIDKYEEKLIYRIINSNYCYFTQAERKKYKGLLLQS